jgi:hypothetical protein
VAVVVVFGKVKMRVNPGAKEFGGGGGGSFIFVDHCFFLMLKSFFFC